MLINAVVNKTPEELALEEKAKKDQAAAKAADEARIHAQTPYDSTLHGVGTTVLSPPQSVKDVWAYVQRMEKRIKALEQRAAAQLTAAAAAESTKVQ
jgi:hypothetical protein